MKFRFINHWLHAHGIILGWDYGQDFEYNYFELTILNFGLGIKWLRYKMQKGIWDWPEWKFLCFCRSAFLFVKRLPGRIRKFLTI